jgi:hypothetical protein
VEGDTTVWEPAKTFIRVNVPVPLDVYNAITSGRMDQFAAKVKANDQSRWLRRHPKTKKITLTPQWDGRTLRNEGLLKAAFQSFDGPSGDLPKFHQDRLQHIHDLTDMEKTLAAGLKNMVAYIELGYEIGTLST